MNVRHKAIAFTVCFACMCLLLGPDTACAAESPRADIQVVKRWQQDDTERPDSVTVHLYADGKLTDSMSLSGDAASLSWTGSFEDLPVYTAGGRAINYTVQEEALPEYDSQIKQQPVLPFLSLSSWGDKVTPASESVYPIGSSNVLVAKKGGDYFVWTRVSLSTDQQEQLIFLVNAASLQGLGKELAFENTLFRAGLPAVFEDSGVSINGSAGDISVEFGASRDWSLFYTGLMGITRQQEAIIENRLQSPSVTPSPTPSTQPSPEPSPTPVQSLSVRKLWQDRDSSMRPDRAIIQLYKDGQAYEQITLNEENGWQHTWDELEADAKWSVLEADVPEGYSSTVQRSDGGFIITNISNDIPATGDVSMFEFYAVTGLLCLMVLTVIVSIPLLITKEKKE